MKAFQLSAGHWRHADDAAMFADLGISKLPESGLTQLRIPQISEGSSLSVDSASSPL